jgi:hypothetical protein
VYQEWLWTQEKFEINKATIDDLHAQWLRNDGRMPEVLTNPDMKRFDPFLEPGCGDVILGRYLTDSFKHKIDK